MSELAAGAWVMAASNKNSDELVTEKRRLLDWVAGVDAVGPLVLAEGDGVFPDGVVPRCGKFACCTGASSHDQLLHGLGSTLVPRRGTAWSSRTAAGLKYIPDPAGAGAGLGVLLVVWLGCDLFRLLPVVSEASEMLTWVPQVASGTLSPAVPHLVPEQGAGV